MTPPRASAGLRLFWGLIGVGATALAVALTLGIAAGGYRPDRYAGGFDPIRAAMVVSFATFAAAFALAAGAGLGARISRQEDIPAANLVMAGGFALLGVVLATLFVSMPASSDPFAVPVPVRIGILLAVAMVAAGVLPQAVSGAVGAVQRRDRGFFVAIAVLAAVVAIGFLARR